jgi:hypothetical protein
MQHLNKEKQWLWHNVLGKSNSHATHINKGVRQQSQAIHTIILATQPRTYVCDICQYIQGTKSEDKPSNSLCDPCPQRTQNTLLVKSPEGVY